MDKERLKNRQSLFEAAMLLYAVKDVLESTSLFRRPEWLDSLFVVVFLVLIVWKMALQTYTLLQIGVIGVLGAMCAYTCINGNYFYIMISFLCIFAMKDVDFAQVVKKVSWLKAGLLSVHVLYYGICKVISPGKISYIYRNGVKRSYFFMSHPNTFSMFVLWTTIGLAYSYYEKLNRIQIGALWMINLFFYVFTNSNTGLMVSTIVFGLMLLEKSGFGLHMILKSSKYVFAGFSIIIPAFTASYTKLSGPLLAVYDFLNDFFTGRLLFGSYVYDIYGISWIGKTIYFPEKTYWRGHWFDEMVFDNAYIWMFVIYGYFYLLLIAAAFILIEKRTTRVEKILIIGYAFYGIMEAYIISATICMPLLLLGKYMYQILEERKNKKNMPRKKLVAERQ